MPRYLAPRPLASDDRVAWFSCRSVEMTNWLRMRAEAAVVSRDTRVNVITADGSPDVLAYYEWRPVYLEREWTGPGRQSGTRIEPQSVVLLARLAVHLDHERRGLGAALMADVIARVAYLSQMTGCSGLLIHTEGHSARQFISGLLPQAVPSPTDDLHLLVRTKDIRRTALAS